MRPTAAHLADTLGLQPHPEGGYYLETYRAAETMQTPRGARPACTAILFLVTEDSASRLHRLSSDELWVYQGGLPLELVTIAPDGELQRRVLGDLAELAAGQAGDREQAGEVSAGSPEGGRDWLAQSLVPAGSWQGARLAGGPHLPAARAWALVSCVVTPGFAFEDFEMGERDALLAAYPAHAELIRELT
ncbi:MAG: cupin domain-containing protein [Actinobacteria bacterium]|nr:cupin domain-containing protein [Actinomycetota bacterium]